jgi:hypothetical protein
MDINTAITGLLDARNQLRSKRGVSDPTFISEQMMRLTQFTGAVEEHLAVYEEELEVAEMQEFDNQLTQGKSVNMSETLAKQKVGSLKGKIAYLKRLVNSSWSIIGVAQSRFNHLNREQGLGKHQT